MPPRSEQFLAVRDALLDPVRRAGYAYVETPLFEDTALYQRGVGESTDVVTKEMYTFTDKGDRSLTLRPEPTAGLMRAFIEHRLHTGPLPVKIYTVGPNFRYERPQAGRYRHFTQADVEAIGSEDPALDAEIVALADEAFTAVHLTGYRLLLTSLGDRTCRPAYRELLQQFLRGIDLDEATHRRVELNPLRVLDDKRPELADRLADAPAMVDHLCRSCRDHYDAVRGHLADLGVRWEEAPRLVRGLDYYTRTTFEFVHDGLGSQSAIGGGGRYDGLMAELGGPDLSGIGWGLGIDRTMLAMDAEGVTLPVPPRVSVFVVPLGEAARRRTVPLAAELRRAGIATDLAYDRRGLKGAMRHADRSGAAYAIVVGDRDLAADAAQLKDLATGEQTTVPLADLVARLGHDLAEHPSQKERTS